MQLFTNNADSALDGAIDTAALSITITSGHGAKFPRPTGGDFFLVTLFQKVGATETNHEIIKCTARTGDVLTVVRAQEGTTAKAFSTADPVELRVTAGTLASKEDGITKSLGYAKWTGTAWSFADESYQAADADLSAIAALTGTTGFLKKTAANTWALDTAAYTTNLGTVTGVTASGPLVSSGGTAPVISLPAATASVAGYLTSANWTTFNNKQAALGFTPYNATNPAGYTSNTGTVTGVTGGAPIVSTGGSTPVITITGATTSTAGSLSAADKTKLDSVASSATANSAGTGITITAGVVSVTVASAADLRAMAGNTVVTGASISAASALVSLTDAPTIAVDWALFVASEIVITTSRLLGNPSNVVPGTSRYVFVRCNSSTLRTLTFGTNYKGDLPVLTDITSTKWYLLTLLAYSSTHIVVSSMVAL